MAIFNHRAQVLFFLLCFCQCTSNIDDTNTDQSMLQLKVEFQTTPIYLNRPLHTEVTLINFGDSSILVNKRMEVGYEKSISRELFAEMINEKNEEEKTYSPAKINRDDPTSADYVILEKGESTTKAFDLFQYYHPRKPGSYKITFYYQADENLKNRPANVWPGILESEPITIEVLLGKLQESN